MMFNTWFSTHHWSLRWTTQWCSRHDFQHIIDHCVEQHNDVQDMVFNTSLIIALNNTMMFNTWFSTHRWSLRWTTQWCSTHGFQHINDHCVEQHNDVQDMVFSTSLIIVFINTMMINTLLNTSLTITQLLWKNTGTIYVSEYHNERSSRALNGRSAWICLHNSIVALALVDDLENVRPQHER